jgi:membrane protein DedA with SNARE-associated domain
MRHAIPGESLLIVAAILSGRGNFSFSSLFFSAWAGAVFGDGKQESTDRL